MKALTIVCPSCRESSDLFLQSQPAMLVLNCPVCGSTLMHLDGETHQIEDMRIINLEKHVLRQFVQNFREQGNVALSHFPGSKPQLAPNLSKPSHKRGEPVREAPISEDDLVNLHIDLERSSGVDDFLGRYITS